MKYSEESQVKLFIWKKIIVRLVQLVLTLFVTGSLLIKNTGIFRFTQLLFDIRLN